MKFGKEGRNENVQLSRKNLRKSNSHSFDCLMFNGRGKARDSLENLSHENGQL